LHRAIWGQQELAVLAQLVGEYEANRGELRRLGMALDGHALQCVLVFDTPFFSSAAPAESARLMLYSGSQSVGLRDPELSAVLALATTAVNFPPMIGDKGEYSDRERAALA
jgi:hypothetical protein